MSQHIKKMKTQKAPTLGSEGPNMQTDRSSPPSCRCKRRGRGLQSSAATHQIDLQLRFLKTESAMVELFPKKFPVQKLKI